MECIYSNHTVKLIIYIIYLFIYFILLYFLIGEGDKNYGRRRYNKFMLRSFCFPPPPFRQLPSFYLLSPSRFAVVL